MIFIFFAVIKLNVSNDTITAGDLIQARFLYKDSIKISLSFNDSDLIEIRDIKIRKAKNGFEYIYNFTSYLPGEKNIILLVDKDTLGQIKFYVKSLLKGDETDIIDIKEPINVFNPYLLFLLLLIPLIGFIIFLVKRPKKKKNKKVEISIPLEEEVLANLENIKEIIEKDLKSFFYNISEIFRYYIEKKFNFPAIESTTSEITYYVKKNRLDELNEFIQFMKEWDIYKFTRVIPEKERALVSYEKVKEFINAHR